MIDLKSEEYNFFSDLYRKLKEDNKKKTENNMKEIINVLGFNLPIQSNSQKIDDIFRILLSSKNIKEIKMILEEISKNNGEFELLDSGSSSIAIKSGDMLIKFGDQRRKYEIPYHPRIMQPKFRKKYESIYDELYLEIFDYGDTESIKITDDVLLEIFKELERDGIFWGDAKKENILVLKKDNELPKYIKGENFNLFGYIEDEKKPLTKDRYKCLKKGDFVICDLDFLFLENDPNKTVGMMDRTIIDYLRMKKYERNKNYEYDNEEKENEK